MNALVIVCMAALHGAQTPAPWWSRALRPGTWQVGFHVQLLTDSSRQVGGHPRKVQLSLWYPAPRARGTALTYSDYLRLAAAETTIVDTARLGQRTLDDRRAFLVSHAVRESTVTNWFQASMLATREAPSSPGPFPLILIAQGNGASAAEQCVLAEYLASWGYLVATSPSQARITGQPETDAEVGAAAQDQALDLAFVRVSVADRYRARIDAAREGVVGHSFGARSALLYAMQDSSVAAIVSLDGGIGTATARASYEHAAAFRPDRMRVPLLHFYELLDKAMAPDWGTLLLLEQAPIWIVRTTGLHHHHFTTLGAAVGAFSGLASPTGAIPETPLEYADVLAMTRAFLDTYLRGDQASWDSRDWHALKPVRLTHNILR